MKRPNLEQIYEMTENAPENPLRTGARGFCLGFGPTLDLFIEARPLQLFYVSRVIIPSAIARYYRVAAFDIDGRSQFVSSGSIPAMAFAENAIGNALGLDPCPANAPIVIRVERERLTLRDRLHEFFGALAAYFNPRSHVYNSAESTVEQLRKALRWFRPSYFPPFCAALIGTVRGDGPLMSEKADS